jgi:hypothetical protein
VLETVQRDHGFRQRRHQLLSRFDLIRCLPFGRTDAGEKRHVPLDLGGEPLLGLVVPLRLLLGCFGALLDLCELSTAAGDRLFGEGLAAVDNHACARLTTGPLK